MSKYFLSDYEEQLFSQRYQDTSHNEETWEDVFNRVSLKVGNASMESYTQFYDMMSKGVAIPSSPQLWNYGSNKRNPLQGSSCFTGDLGDSIGDFIKCDKEAHEVYMSSGGFGVLANKVRPRGAKISYSKSMSVGAMGIGGPVRKLEKTTGYITNGGRERGALMVQLSAWHPDAVEFILSKVPVSLGFLDDWPANARAVLGKNDVMINSIIELYASRYSFEKEWPTVSQVREDLSYNPALGLALGHMIFEKVLQIDDMQRLVPYVMDWYIGEAGGFRPANRDWDLPLQNCNISVRIPDSMIHSARRGDNWVFSWFSEDGPKPGTKPWVLTDIGGGPLRTLEDGEYITVNRTNDEISCSIKYDETGNEAPRYGVVITTWEGLKENLKPNPNNWKDVEYARFYRKVLMPHLDHLKGPIMAQQVLDLIFEAAHSSADPGVVFEDTYERFNPVDSKVYGERLSNPCSEFINPPGGSCNLVSINLRGCSDTVSGIEVDMTREFNDAWNDVGLSSSEDWEILRNSISFNILLMNVRESTKTAYKYIMEAHEINKVPVEFIDIMSHDHFRTVGVGIMGLAESLMAFHIAYGSECARSASASIMAEVYVTCWEESFKLANKGWPVPKAWNKDKMKGIFIKRIDLGRMYNIPESINTRITALVNMVRHGKCATNTCVTSVAPTGTISQIAGWVMSRNANRDISVTSSGEPPFSWYTYRKDNSGFNMVSHDLWGIPEHHNKPWMKTSSTTTPEEHVYVQAAICAFCCMSVSKTINMAENATVEDVAKGYLMAWELGVPGTSVYRDKSKPMQVLSALDCPSGDCSIDVQTPEDVYINPITDTDVSHASVSTK